MDSETLKTQLLSVLSEGENDARQLYLRSNEDYQTALMHLQSKFSQAIAIASSMEETSIRQMPSHSHKTASGSPGRSGSGSPKSDASERTSRKRKDAAKRTVKVSTTPSNGSSDAALPPDDGYSWRKYGQKNILNSNNPRSYYRCTYQKSQNCPAVKHVQRSDEDPAMLDVTYQGDHTCTQQPGQTSLAQSLEHQLLIPTQNESNDQQFMINFDQSYPAAIETHESYQEEQGTILSPPSISSAQAGLSLENPNVFSSSGTSFGGPFSPGFMSSGAPNSNYFSVYPSEFGGEFGGVSGFHGSEFGFGSDVIPMPQSDTSAINAFPTDQPDYPFNTPHHFK